MTLGTLCQAESFPVSWFWPVTKTPPHGQELKQLSGDILSLLLVPLLPLSPDCFVLSCAVSSPIVHVSWRTSRYSSISLETLACLEERLLTWAFTSIACYFSLSGFAGWFSVVAFASVPLLLRCMASVIFIVFWRQFSVTNQDYSGLIGTSRVYSWAWSGLFGFIPVYSGLWWDYSGLFGFIRENAF